ncbi:polysaccharide biosynthesis protein [Thermoproteota archaeon]
MDLSFLDKITLTQRKLILILLDSLAAACSLYFAFAVKFSLSQAFIILKASWWLLLLFIIIRIILNHFHKLYILLWRYASIRELVRVVQAVTISSILFTALFIGFKLSNLTVSILLADWAFNIILTGGIRITLRLIRDYLAFIDPVRYSDDEKINLIIIGAGDAGAMIAKELSKPGSAKYNLSGFADDNGQKIGQMIHNAPVLGTIKQIPQFVKDYDIKEAIIAIPTASGKLIRQIIRICEKARLAYRITPCLYDIIDGTVHVNQLREVRIEDLLGREVVEIDMTGISKHLTNQTILVTGAGGSIGAELCRQIITFKPRTILVLDNSENALYHIELELSKMYKKGTIIPLIADVKNRRRLDKIFQAYTPQIIFHAAAYKHVPLMEISVEEVVQNNIVGTKNMLELANQYNALQFVLVSTDKAVYPANCMGASKRICEVLMQIQAGQSNTCFTAVRFGNVLGSQGSVVPLFKYQIEQGGPVTVTHPEMTRFFMTIPEACRLVIQAGALAKGGEIFVLDMGEPVNILSLAKDMIHLSGLEVNKDIAIKFSGLRRGEKLSETLFFDKESLTSTAHNKISVATAYNYDPGIVKKDIDHLLSLIQNYESEKTIKQALFSIVEETLPQYTKKVRA